MSIPNFSTTSSSFSAAGRWPRQFDSDISVVLQPLPKVPILICYWLPEEGMDSNLLVFFDETADRNLDTDSVFTLGVGLAHMIKKLALKHGFAVA